MKNSEIRKAAEMKNHPIKLMLRAAALFLLLLPGVTHAQFTYVTNAGTITITGYTGPGGSVVVPDTIEGFPVTTIGDSAFEGTALTNSLLKNPLFRN
jgi:hypothetical protein